MNFEEAHAWEDFLMEEFKTKFPDEKIPYFGSTWKAHDWLKKRIYGEKEEGT